MIQTNVDEVEIVDWSLGPESETLNAELKEKLEEAIGLLSEDLRMAVVLRDVQELSNEQAAQVLEISIPAFKARLHRGRLHLRAHLSSYVRAPRS
jgi:RNA polymerase sigma-70 factor (ECF subfamily)